VHSYIPLGKYINNGQYLLSVHKKAAARRFAQASVRLPAGKAVYWKEKDKMRSTPLVLLASFALHVIAATRPNIILLLSDDQDKRLGSTDFQGVLQRELVAKGTEFVNHHVTVAQCCPSRTSLFRGQAAHNTNVTHVQAPG
jgi:hypothetical protein